ncbi:hypothetical protein K503DRAFT_775417 [Rhizopogon vinicolor AM-OR11-026]|uniref:Uncharacterized protein n=1 Tax=Rhizopogon vinicolor AM-OR11-026 TaxID=1314800 RepID=A0A1B7MM24_9AGAM|nr:hypothetical protein K503DRAFT_775417 [Rhizopogon vinicolor AM-OR11-026]
MEYITDNQPTLCIDEERCAKIPTSAKTPYLSSTRHSLEAHLIDFNSDESSASF